MNALRATATRSAFAKAQTSCLPSFRSMAVPRISAVSGLVRTPKVMWGPQTPSVRVAGAAMPSHHVAPMRSWLHTRPPTAMAEEKIVDAEVVEPTVEPTVESASDHADPDLSMAEALGGSAGAGTPAAETKAEEPMVEEPTEQISGASKKLSFQTETRQILDIVAHSLYTDKEVFLRELISNASDALEKARYLQSTNQTIADADRPLEIHITLDKDRNTLTIQDTGVGMNEDELVENLGTIARSGSKAFVKAAMEQGTSAAAKEDIIGQFGVGFYSSFMVADKVDVYSQSAQLDEDGNVQEARYWTSDGLGSFEMAPADGVKRGTKIVVHLKDTLANEYTDGTKVEGIIKRYSNFVGFPIYLNQKRINTVGALWTLDRNSITDKQHEEFYRYISGAWDSPKYRLHYVADVPVSIKALFYVPNTHTEKHGMGRMDPGVSLYSRKVLIQAKCETILPEWCRFIKGVVDSEDIPLHISRENMQDSGLIARIKSVLTRKIIRFLDEEGRKNPDTYNVFFKEFGSFIKEGVVTDNYHKMEVGKLLRYETSKLDSNKLTSLDDYISRMYPQQKAVYYLLAPNRRVAENSPYYESFKAKGIEVLFLYHTVDEFVMKNLESYNKRKLVSIESTQADESNMPDLDDQKKQKDEKKEKAVTLTPQQVGELTSWLKDVLNDRVTAVSSSNRLVHTPAIIVDHQSAAVRRMMSYIDQDTPQTLPKQKLEINPQHEVMKSLHSIRNTRPQLATLVAQQVFDNALIAADLMETPQNMLPRINSILAEALDSAVPKTPKPTTPQPTQTEQKTTTDTSKGGASKDAASSSESKKPSDSSSSSSDSSGADTKA